MDLPPLCKHAYVVSIQECELVAYRNLSYICLSHWQGRQAKHTCRRKTDALLPKLEEKQTKHPTHPKQHITPTIALFFYFFLLCCLLYLPLPPFIHATLQSPSLTSQLCRKGNTFPFWKHPPPQPKDPVSFSLVIPIHQEGTITGKEILAYTGVRSKQGLTIPHQLLGNSPLPGAGCSELPAHQAGSCVCKRTGCPLPTPRVAKMMLWSYLKQFTYILLALAVHLTWKSSAKPSIHRNQEPSMRSPPRLPQQQERRRGGKATRLRAQNPLPIPWTLPLRLSAVFDWVATPGAGAAMPGCCGRAGAAEPTSRCELAVDLRVHFLVAHVASDLLRRLSDDGNS